MSYKRAFFILVSLIPFLFGVFLTAIYIEFGYIGGFPIRLLPLVDIFVVCTVIFLFLLLLGALTFLCVLVAIKFSEL